MLIRRIKCPHCKEEINTGYIYNGFCPVCKKTFESSRQKISKTDLQQLKKDKTIYMKNTMTKGQIKKMFKLTEGQLSGIPCTSQFGLSRYLKTDILKYVNNSQ